MRFDERKFCGQEKRDEENGQRDDVRSDRIECGEQARGNQMSQQAAGRNRAAHFRDMPEREQRWEHQHQHRVADDLDDRGFQMLAAEPARSQDENAHRQEKHRIAEALEQQVRAIGADRADPVAGRMQVGGFGGNIERRIVRAVGNQRQRHQDGDRHADKTNQFIETMIFRWSQNAHKYLLKIGGRCSSQEGCAGAGARIPSGSTRATHRLYQRPAGRQEG